MIRDILHQNEEAQPTDKTLGLLHRNFPQCFNVEGKFDIAAFRELLNDKVDIIKEGSGFNFLGKNYASLVASMDTTTVLVPDTEHNSKPENANSRNLYISGENLDALKHLVKSYAGKVKCIYIDPPYNTGSDGFVYNDKFKFTAEELEEKLSVSEEQAKRILAMTTRGAASHSAWLTFMMPRLQYAKDLLSDDGVIFISIDDNEQANLKQLCDNVFGEENFVALFPWRKRTAKSDVPFGVSQDYEWILAYARTDKFLAGIDGKNRKYYETEDFPGRPWRIHDMTTQRTALERPNSDFTMVNPKNGNEYPVNPQAVWRITKEGFPQYLKENRIIFPGDYDFLKISKPVLRYWKEDDMRKAGNRFGQCAVSTNLPATVGMSQDGTKDIDSLFNAKIFSFPKPISLIKYLIDGAVEKDKEEPVIILDFFSGSATTAQAVMELNSADDGYNLQYILVQLPEKIKPDTDAYTHGYRTIDMIGQERIRRAAAKIKSETNADIDYGFKHYTIREPNENTLELMERFTPNMVFGDDILQQFGKETVLATYAMRDGYGLTPETELVKFGNYTAYLCGRHLYMIDPEFDIDGDELTELVDKYNKDHSFTADTVVIFGYSFYFSQIDAIKKNLSAITDRSRINIDIRY
ncbi:site-specific DNA-methyltransferase [Palleniella muris]|uniref:Site-specific DNA-methyltransferase n=1 Tax=Palleniella muris TaxID=3038145 RepID=A0AC61QLQ6_9BACT|nr:site-specific DNA-methyltransferase [Palleniella muris]TGX79905.1 site-specific DNA-methyltransferase [Palleniella muris]